MTDQDDKPTYPMQKIEGFNANLDDYPTGKAFVGERNGLRFWAIPQMKDYVESSDKDYVPETYEERYPSRKLVYESEGNDTHKVIVWHMTPEGEPITELAIGNDCHDCRPIIGRKEAVAMIVALMKCFDLDVVEVGE